MIRPVIMGGLMGIMMLWMLHGAMAGNEVTGWAMAAFIGAHLVLFAVAALAAVFVTRLSPRLRGVLARVHRPSARHIGAMFGSALAVMGLVHLSAHGIGVV